MGQYYGIQRSNEFLAHYGVKGMRWGVRKAIERGDRAALMRHYEKAKAKLNKLDLRAKTGKGIAGRRMAAGGLASAALSAAGTYALNRAQGASRAQAGLTAGMAGLAGGAGGAILNAGKASPAEMSRAKMQRDDWAREMNRAFRGTQYANKVSAKQERQLAKGLNRLATNFENHYQAGLKRGMSHEQAENYANKKQTTRQDAKNYAQQMNRNMMRAQLIGGPVGQAVAMNRMIRDNPQAYENYKKQFKKMTPKQRLKAMYGRG